jgi:hypothetical protein
VARVLVVCFVCVVASVHVVAGMHVVRIMTRRVRVVLHCVRIVRVVRALARISARRRI